MKTRITLFVLFVWMLAACAPAPTAPSTEPPVATSAAEATEPPATEAPTSIPTPTPSLQVGDTYSHMDGTNLVAVPAGEFTMGGEGSDNPAHSVKLSDFWIYSTLVTNQQYALCVQLGKCTSPDLTDNPGYADINRANRPVTGVTYDQAAAYCSFAGGRLPTEAEWEKAAGSSNGGSYPWGDQPPSCDLANFEGCVGGKSNVTEHTGGASSYGALDMLGNVFQWVADWYDADYYNNSSADDPTGPASGTARVLRSSGFNSTLDQLSILNRGSEDPQTHRSDIGFRCVVEQPQQFAPLCELPPVYGENAATSTCPVLEVKSVELCAQSFPYTNVTVSGADDAKIASECSPTDDPSTVSCQPPPSTVSAQAECQVDISGEPSCPSGYSLQGDRCVADGAPGSCPTGLTQDSTKQCCALPAVAETSPSLGVCPAGTYYVASQNACLPSPVQELVTVSLEVTFKSCAARPGGGGGGGSGNENEGGGNSCVVKSCGPTDVWSPSLCCCTVYFNPNVCAP